MVLNCKRKPVTMDLVKLNFKAVICKVPECLAWLL